MAGQASEHACIRSEFIVSTRSSCVIEDEIWGFHFISLQSSVFIWKLVYRSVNHLIFLKS